MEVVFKEIEELSLQLESVLLNHPYRLNIIEELHINENGHSRILTKLLQYRNPDGKYVFLESLLQYINDLKHISFPIHIVNPIITQEQERIDLWVRDKDYAIIFENKACDASDQEAQLYRYIEKTERRGYNKEQIYIVYLPSTNECEPSEQTWGGLKEKFESRFVQMSFREDVVKWMSSQVLSFIDKKDNLLFTAITQYLDYLKQIFNLNIEQNMETEIYNKIDHILNLPCDAESKVKDLDLHISKIQDVINTLNNYRQKVDEQWRMECQPLIDEYISDILSKNTELKKSSDGTDGVSVNVNDKTLDLIINKDNRWYVQLQWPSNTLDTERVFNPEIWNVWQKDSDCMLNQYSRNDYIWRYCSTLEETFRVFGRVLNKLLNIE